MDSFRIERAIALVDPMGLLRIGAPLDEYSSESRAIWSILAPSFSKTDFFKVYHKVMKESFGGTLCRLSQEDSEDMFHLLSDGTDPTMKFYRGDVYKVVRSPHTNLYVQIYSVEIRTGDFLTVIDRFEKSNRVELGFLLNNRVMYKNMDLEEEARMRWFFQEVE